VLRLADVEYGPEIEPVRTIDLSAICTDLFEFFEPLATSSRIAMTLRPSRPFRFSAMAI